MQPFKILMFLILLGTLNSCHHNIANNDPKVLVITSNPERFDGSAFFDMIFSITGYSIDTISQPRANQALLSDSIQKYQAILFYDMWQDITDEQKEAFIKLTEKGTGMVFLHHSLVSYQEWDIFPRIIGGKYFHDRFTYPAERYSTYKHNIELKIEIIDENHPVTYGMNHFTIMEEGYDNIFIFNDVVPILQTDHPHSVSTIGWINRFNQSTNVYIMPGHGPDLFHHPQYRKLIANALGYVSKQTE
ncbi:ThuA domain-containing protein [Natronoflexus pectinivorans]|uniref:ThuA-like domain-containing protein n=1 Tax=Natronoflexus pectinivorans TaxID=682526 RepID=A0A4R2GGC5_9BACT|nr:ThuA domain-containing protein [Natronoflexus pectinivorans]TCO07326.1 hypothetical protein EV194_109145 [Natronoflexus pectinivorans]